MCNEITEQSLQVAQTIYDTFWYKESKQYNVLLQLMLMGAQRPVTMRIGPFGAMTTSTILTTMRAAYSYATLMMNSS
uniref:Odorant receptor 24 n=1 Tax=Ips typographus TaxID=55986 RepID=M3V885_IPSTY